MMKIEIYIATHKAYEFPQIDSYIPIHVGKEKAKVDLGILGDNIGENISTLNPSFCELTALYWMWKNAQADILGLVHYRRYFVGAAEDILTSQEVESLAQNEVIVAKTSQFYKVSKVLGVRLAKRTLSVREHYAKDHYEQDLNSLRRVIVEQSPEYLTAFDYLCQSKEGISLFNMFIMHKGLVNEYCQWMFKVLFQLEQIIDISSYDAYQKRIFGFLSERMFNIFLIKNQAKLKIRQLDVVLK